MKLGFISTAGGAPWGGSEELWAAAALAAVRRGTRVDAFVYNWPQIPLGIRQLREAGVEVVWRRREPRGLVARACGKTFRLRDTIWRQLPDNDADILVFSQGGTFDVARCEPLAAYLTQAGRPFVVISQHNDEYPLSSEVRRRAIELFSRARHVAFVSEANRLTAERQLATALPNSSVVQNPVNLRSLDSVAWPDDGGVEIACVARLDVHFKGQDVLLQVLAAPNWRDRVWRLNLYGEGIHGSYLQELIHHYRLDGRVRFCGQVSDVAEIWRSNHLLVLPSRSEGTPLALIEALICGRPAAVTDVGGSASWVQDDVSGFVADAATPRSLGAAMERAWSRRSDWKAMGAAAHEQTSARIDHSPGETLMRSIFTWCGCR